MWCFFTGPAVKVLSMELVPPNKARTLFEHCSTHEEACLKVFHLVKVLPKLLSRKRRFCDMLEP